MRFAVSVPNFGAYGDMRLLVELARDAEAAGWDAMFLWDHIAWPPAQNFVDPWLTLTAIALSTERLRVGPMITPLPRRRPWKVARETVTLDHLSGGRLILGVGSGIHPDEFDRLGEEPDLKTRAAMLDEGLAVLAGLWTGEPFTFRGQHYTVEGAHFRPPPVQRPRPPIWVAGTWPRRKPLQRAARWDGYVPDKTDQAPYTADDVRAIVAAVAAERERLDGFDIVLGGDSGDRDRARSVVTIASFAAAGATWWNEAFDPQVPPAAARERILLGPPQPV